METDIEVLNVVHFEILIKTGRGSWSRMHVLGIQCVHLGVYMIMQLAQLSGISLLVVCHVPVRFRGS